MTSRYALLGLDDEVTTCELCGKADLKCTMALSEMDADGNELGIVRFGRDCGARALGWRVSANRAEKFIDGTATLRGNLAYAAYSAAQQYGVGHYTGTPARVDIDGAPVEVWDARYRQPPGERWALLGRSSGYRYIYWRIAA